MMIPASQTRGSDPQDPRRPNNIVRYRAPVTNNGQTGGETGNSEDTTADYVNTLGLILSMCGLMMRLKWASWLAVLCSCIAFANTRAQDDSRQMLTSFMLSVSAVVMCYLQNPQPMTPPWASGGFLF